jgi:hypothetical protein
LVRWRSASICLREEVNDRRYRVKQAGYCVR